MLLARLAELAREVARDPALSGEMRGCVLFYHHAEKWWEVGGSEVTSVDLSRDLDRTLQVGKPWRHPRSTYSYYPLSANRAVVRVAYESPTWVQTRTRHAEQLERCLTQATHRFDATHDIHTGLLNGPEFTRRLGVLLSEAQAAVGLAATATAASESSPSLMVAVFALDVDRFKQVNDTHGHLYGDLVLQVVAARLITVTKGLAQQYQDVRFEVARPGGEEFLIGASGPLSAAELIQLGERIRESISSIQLPTDAELIRHSGNDPDGPIQGPPLSERGITISVGMATVDQSRNLAEASAIRTARDRADRAMYSAKSGGRNCVRAFADILRLYGTVIEEHPDTGVVTIDIGRAVGVTIGQEFMVYHPDFTGNSSVIADDGRSRRALGTYPRIASGRVVVFNVQPDIAFARFEHKTQGTRIPKGAQLEAIPLGSIAHLLPTTGPGVTVRGRGLMTAEDFERTVRGMARERPANVAVFYLHNEETLANDYGSAGVNDSLAKMYLAIVGEVAPGTPVGQVAISALAVVVGHAAAELHVLAETVVATASAESNGRAEFGAGIYTGLRNLGTPWDRSQLRPEEALAYARLAAAAGRANGEEITVLDESAIVWLAFSARTANAQQALTDHAEYRRLGFDNPRLTHQAALAALELKQPERARDLLLQIVAELPDGLDERRDALLNLGLAQWRANDGEAAHETFNKVEVNDIGNPYIYAAVQAAVESWRLARSEREHSRALALVAKGIELSDPVEFPNRAASLAGLRRELDMSS